MTAAMHEFAQLLALRMVDSLAWGTVVVLFAAIVLRVTRQNAGTRFAVWFSALLAIGLVPWVTFEWRPRELISSSTVGRAAITLPDQWAVFVCIVWALIAAWFAVGIGRAIWHLHVLRRGCGVVDPTRLDPILRETLRRGAQRRVALCTSGEIRVPTALGLRKPMIVLPRWVMDELPVSEVNQILLHELAHLRRWDDWTNLVQQGIKAVFFFHPAVWWIERKVALEREMACDDAVLAETASPRAYAECLAHLAERSFIERGVALAHAALGKIRHTSLRIAEILNGKRDTAPSRGWKPAVSLVGVFAVACGVWAARVPNLIAFQDEAPAQGSQSSAAVRGTDLAQIQRADAGNTPSVPITPAKFTSDPYNRKLPHKTSTRGVRSAKSKPEVSNIVHLAAVQPAIAPFTETVFFVVEGRDGSSLDMRVFQIQMFHVTILQQVAPANRIPPKQT